MKGQSQTKDVVQIIVGGLSLLALLSYTLVHTGGLLSSYVRPGTVGYVAAFGIELSIVGLSLRIGDLRKSGQDVKFFVGVLVAVVVVSALANIAEGFKVNQGVNLTFETVQRLDIVQAVIGLAATGLISLIVFALAEIVGTDVNTAVKAVEKASRIDSPQVTTVKPELASQASNTEELNTFPAPVEQARAVKVEQDSQAKAKALDTILVALNTNPDTPITELARLVGKSRTTVYSYLDELEASGRIHRNGNVKVMVETGQ